MSRSKLHGLAVAGVLVVAIGSSLAACGSANGDNQEGKAGAGDAALRELLPADVRSAGVLTVAVDATSGPPFAQKVGAEIEGINADLTDAIGEQLGLEVNLVDVPFDGITPGLEAKRYDLSASTMLDTKERQKSVDFVDFMKDGSGFLVPESSDQTDLALGPGLCGKKVAVGRGSFEAMSVADESTKCTAAGKAAISIETFSGVNTATLAVTSGRVEIYAGSASQNAFAEVQYKGKLKRSGAHFGVGIVGMAFPKGSELIEPIRAALQKLMDDGTYADIFAKYNQNDSVIDQATVNHALS